VVFIVSRMLAAACLQALAGDYGSSLPCRQDGGAHRFLKRKKAIISTVRVEQDVRINLIVIKCTTLKHWHAIDVHMLGNVMDLVHLYRHCVRHGRPLDELCAKWCSCVSSHVFKAN